MWYIIGKIEIAGNVLGYVLANPETKQTQAVPIHQMSTIASQLYNAKVANGQVELTDGSASRLFYFDTNLRPIQDSTPNRIFIFSEDLDRKGNTYSVFTLSGFFVITEDQLKAYDGKATLINGKFVHQDGKLVISALRGTFPKSKATQQRTAVNPYATPTKEDKPAVNKKKSGENPTHKQFRERLQRAILEYSANPNAINLMVGGVCAGNRLAKVYKVNDIWIRAIKEPGFIYCDDTLIQIAKNSKTIVQFVRSANMYFVYLQKTGKHTGLPIKYSRYTTNSIYFRSYKLPPEIKINITKVLTNNILTDPSAVSRLYFAQGKLCSDFEDTIKKAIDFSKETGVTYRTTALRKQDLQFSCSAFLKTNSGYDYWPRSFNFEYISQVTYYIRNHLKYHKHKEVPNTTLFYLRLWYNTIRKPIPGYVEEPEAKILEDLMLSHDADMTGEEWFNSYKSMTGYQGSINDFTKLLAQYK